MPTLYYVSMMRLALLFLGILAVGIIVYAGWQTLRMRHLIRIGKTLAINSIRFEQLRDGGSKRILVVGDSTAVGTGARDRHGSIAGYFGRDFPRAEIRNFGVNGCKAEGLALNFPTLKEHMDLVMIQIGANDMVQGTPMDAFSKSLASVFDQAKLAGTHVVALHSGNIGLAPLFPWPLNSILRSRTLRYGAEYRRIAAEKGVTYVDLFHEKNDDPFKGELRFYGEDQFHLSEAGYLNWYQETRKAMERSGIFLKD